MPSTPSTILDQISAERTKVSERLARLETERAYRSRNGQARADACRQDARCQKTYIHCRRRSKGFHCPPSPRAAPKSSREQVTRTRREPSAPSLGERVLALATGRTRQELYMACANDRPNHVGIAVQRHLRAGRLQERDGKLYAISPQLSRCTRQPGDHEEAAARLPPSR